MPHVGFDTFFPKTCPTVFRVKNTADNNKTIRIFNYPIKNGKVRDLMAIPYVSEADIRHALLKGNLGLKLRYGEARVVESNIDLLQFDECHKAFLQSVGITEGLEVNVVAEVPYIFRQGVRLIGATDGLNRIFTVPTPDKFVNGTLGNNEFRILVKHNGRDLVEGIDYITSESGGPGTGYDTIIFCSITPNSKSIIVADYIIEA